MTVGARPAKPRIRQAGERILFAWAGGTAMKQPHYYRVQAPTFLVEYDCTQDGANHIHSVWRDLSGNRRAAVFRSVVQQRQIATSMISVG